MGGEDDFLPVFRRIVCNDCEGSSACFACDVASCEATSVSTIWTGSPSHALASDDIDDCDSLTEAVVDGDADDAESTSLSRGSTVACAVKSPIPAIKRPTPCTPSRSPAAPITLAGRPVTLPVIATVLDRVCLIRGASVLLIDPADDPVVGVTNPRLTIFSHLRLSSRSSAS